MMLAPWLNKSHLRLALILYLYLLVHRLPCLFLSLSPFITEMIKRLLFVVVAATSYTLQCRALPHPMHNGEPSHHYQSWAGASSSHEQPHDFTLHNGEPSHHYQSWAGASGSHQQPHESTLQPNHNHNEPQNQIWDYQFDPQYNQYSLNNSPDLNNNQYHNQYHNQYSLTNNAGLNNNQYSLNYNAELNNLGTQFNPYSPSISQPNPTNEEDPYSLFDWEDNDMVVPLTPPNEETEEQPLSTEEQPLLMEQQGSKTTKPKTKRIVPQSYLADIGHDRRRKLYYMLYRTYPEVKDNTIRRAANRKLTKDLVESLERGDIMRVHPYMPFTFPSPNVENLQQVIEEQKSQQLPTDDKEAELDDTKKIWTGLPNYKKIELVNILYNDNYISEEVDRNKITTYATDTMTAKMVAGIESRIPENVLWALSRLKPRKPKGHYKRILPKEGRLAWAEGMTPDEIETVVRNVMSALNLKTKDRTLRILRGGVPSSRCSATPQQARTILTASRKDIRKIMRKLVPFTGRNAEESDEEEANRNE
jgi:hypothetical protein